MYGQSDMIARWKLIPRYHSQFGPRDTLCSLISKRSNIVSPSQELGFLSDNKKTFWLNGATAALSIMLKALDLPAGSGVGVPIYTCVTVFEAVASAGLRCVFIDIDPETFGFDIKSLKNSREQLAAVIMVHTFGFAGDIKAIKEVVGDLPIIEDCSHALYCFRNNRHVGLQGVAGVFSFNIHKPLSAGGGGLLVVNDPSYHPMVKQLFERIPKDGFWCDLRTTLKLFFKSAAFRAPWYGLLTTSGFVDLYRHGSLHYNVRPKSLSRINQVFIAHGLNQLESRLKKQKANCCKIAAATENMLPASNFINAGNSWNGYLLPILVETREQRQASLEYFHYNNIDAFVLWPECLETAGKFGYCGGDCPCFEDAFERMFLLPCYAELKKSQFKQLEETAKMWRRSVKSKTINRMWFIIQGERIILRHIKFSDVRDVFAAIQDSDVAKQAAPFEKSFATNRVLHFLKRIPRYAGKTIRYFWWKLFPPKNRRIFRFGISLKESGKIVGMVVLTRKGKQLEYGEVGFWIIKEHWGKGLTTEALKMVIDFAFNYLGLEKMDGWTVEENIGSRRVMEKCGFKLCGPDYTRDDKSKNKKERLWFMISKSEYHGQSGKVIQEKIYAD